MIAVCVTLSLITYLLLRRLRERTESDAAARLFTPLRRVAFADASHRDPRDRELNDSEIAAKLDSAQAAKLRRRL